MADKMEERLQARFDELKDLYDSVYPGDTAAFAYFCGMLRRMGAQRGAALRGWRSRTGTAPGTCWA